jgi:hypothetical protein
MRLLPCVCNCLAVSRQAPVHECFVLGKCCCCEGVVDKPVYLHVWSAF